ncbi:hypothetical protein M0802_011705 [Mischocyttarus mexicanus]|nr:hypothetical protein M0802_011705 [Mischocyttarus mexicanus]
MIVIVVELTIVEIGIFRLSGSSSKSICHGLVVVAGVLVCKRKKILVPVLVLVLVKVVRSSIGDSNAVE